jgi:hypothetical protein|tara:strand:+ start:496 stop:708 length:213 start_codon:yes stop_codon:yes gene_type:complete
MKYRIDVELHETVEDDPNFIQLMKSTINSTLALNTFNWGTKGKVSNPMFSMKWGPVETSDGDEKFDGGLV